MPYPGTYPRRGEIYWVDWDPARGSEQAGRRPALVISPDDRNRLMHTLVIAAMTTTVRDAERQGRSPVALFLPAGQPMTREGVVLGFQLMTISELRLDGYAASLSPQQMLEVDRIVRKSFGL